MKVLLKTNIKKTSGESIAGNPLIRGLFDHWKLCLHVKVYLGIILNPGIAHDVTITLVRMTSVE